MAKTKISEFSATPANNTDIDSINIAEGCAPSGINDAIRELMSQLKDFQTGAQGDSFNGPIGSTTPAAGAFTTLSASSTATLSGLTASTALALDASKNIVSVTNTGTGSNVLATSPTLVTPNLGVPSFATLTSATGLPISTGVSGLGTGVATFLATPSSANLASAVTDETGSGALVFATSPTLVTPALGSPSSVGTMPAFTLGGTVSGGGNQINNVIIGTSTPLAGAFTTVTASTAIGTASGGTGLGGATPFTSGGVVYASSTSALATGSALTFDGTNLNLNSATPPIVRLQSATTSSAMGLDFYYTDAGNSKGGLVANFGAGEVRLSSGASGNTYFQSFYTNGSERMRLDSAGNLGVNTTSPSYKIDAIGSTSSNSGIVTTLRLKNGGEQVNDGAKISFTSGTSTEGAGIGSGGQALNSADLRFYAGGNTERARFNTTGAMVFAGGTTSANGVGITFPATQSASSDANTLDDYEEGTWTPNQGGNLTVVGTFSSSGTYTKIGRIVVVQGQVTGSTSITVTQGGLVCSNLPFTVSGNAFGAMTNNAADIAGIAWGQAGSIYAGPAIAATSNIRFTNTYFV